jgi:hypothetical protein
MHEIHPPVSGTHGRLYGVLLAAKNLGIRAVVWSPFLLANYYVLNLS